MATSLATIQAWYDEGFSNGARYMIVWCDDYDYSDYPSYYHTEGDAQRALNNPMAMQRAMECYYLDGDRDAQLSMHRCWALRRQFQ